MTSKLPSNIDSLEVPNNHIKRRTSNVVKSNRKRRKTSSEKDEKSQQDLRFLPLNCHFKISCAFILQKHFVLSTFLQVFFTGTLGFNYKPEYWYMIGIVYHGKQIHLVLLLHYWYLGKLFAKTGLFYSSERWRNSTLLYVLAFAN